MAKKEQPIFAEPKPPENIEDTSPPAPESAAVPENLLHEIRNASNAALVVKWKELEQITHPSAAGKALIEAVRREIVDIRGMEIPLTLEPAEKPKAPARRA